VDFILPVCETFVFAVLRFLDEQESSYLVRLTRSEGELLKTTYWGAGEFCLVCLERYETLHLSYSARHRLLVLLELVSLEGAGVRLKDPSWDPLVETDETTHYDADVPLWSVLESVPFAYEGTKDGSNFAEEKPKDNEAVEGFQDLCEEHREPFGNSVLDTINQLLQDTGDTGNSRTVGLQDDNGKAKQESYSLSNFLEGNMAAKMLSQLHCAPVLIRMCTEMLSSAKSELVAEASHLETEPDVDGTSVPYEKVAQLLLQVFVVLRNISGVALTNISGELDPRHAQEVSGPLLELIDALPPALQVRIANCDSTTATTVLWLIQRFAVSRLCRCMLSCRCVLRSALFRVSSSKNSYVGSARHLGT
jgi:hypothetical protein